MANLKKNKNLNFSLALFLLFIIIFILKGFIIFFLYKNLTPTKYLISYFINDILVFSIIYLLTTISSGTKYKFIRIITNILSLIIILLFTIDIGTIKIFQSHISIPGMFIIIRGGTHGFLGTGILCLIGFLTLIYICLLITELSKLNTILRKLTTIKTFLIYFIILIGIHLFVLYNKTLYIYYYNTPETDSIITLNISSIKQAKDIPFPEHEFNEYTTTIKGKSKNFNVVLVFAESLSAIDSKNAGGYDNMPHFDKIQNNGLIFTNFIANGLTSDTAKVSSILGIIPLYIGYDYIPFLPPIADFFNKLGYKTTYISSSDTKFLKQNEFYEKAGFQRIIGEQDFENNKKYTFNSAPDEYLYAKAIKEIDSQTGKYFIGLQTISFHKEYNTPYGNTKELALKYADETLYKFYTELKKRNFFENGILIILGDHRMQNPIQIGEYDKLGPNRMTRSVATIIGTGIIPGTINSNIIQHTDFYNSLKILFGSGSVDIYKYYNDVFSNKTNRNRGITFDESKGEYIITTHNKQIFQFTKLSDLESKYKSIYDYLTAYKRYESKNIITQSNL